MYRPANSLLKGWPGVLAVISAYTAVRLLLIPDVAHRTFAFTHDSAYLVIIAENLLAGAGFVNPGHWLVFLHPDALPVPYHQANPLMPLLIAGLSVILPVDTVGAGFIISAVMSGLLVLGLVLLLTPYLGSPWKALPVAFFGALFPLVFEDSLRLLADSTYAVFVVLLAAMLVRTGGRMPDPGPSIRVWIPEPRLLIASGILLGLAWLTRSQAILLLPALLLFLVLRGGARAGLHRFAVIGLTAAVVASPWLVRQYQVWGDPLYSEAGYYLVQDLVAAREFGGEVERYWHSPDPPPGLAEAFLSDPRGSAIFLAEGGAQMIRRYLRALGVQSRLTLLLLIVAAGAFVMTAVLSYRERPWSPELVSVAVLVLCTIAAFSLRPYTAEVRYFGVATLAFAVLAALGGLGAWEWAARLGGRRAIVAMAAVVILVSGVWGWRVLPGTVSTYRYVTQPDPLMAGYRQLARIVDGTFSRGEPVVVGMKPYFYSLATGASGLSIPESGDDFLKRYMRRYGACFILLKDFELRYWRPRWEAEGAPQWLVRRADFPEDLAGDGVGVEGFGGKERQAVDVSVPRAILFEARDCEPGTT